MKKIWSILVVAASMMLLFLSCVKEMQPGIGGGGEGEEILPDPDEPSGEILPDEQKVKLENVAVDLMNMCQADDFRTYMNLVDRFMALYIDNEDYDLSVITDAADESWNKILTQTEKEVFEKITNKFVREDIDNFTLVLSQHTGEFYFAEDGVVKTGTDKDALRVIVPVDGEIYVAELRQSGAVTTAFYDCEDYYEYSGNSGYWDSEKGEYVSIYPDTLHEFNKWVCCFAIDVPDRIDINLAYNGGPSLAEISLEFSRSFTAEGLDPAVDNFNAKTTVSFDNGYSIENKKFKYDGLAESAGVSISFMKGGMELVTAVANCDAKLKNTVHTYDYSDDYCVDRGEYTSVEVVRADSVRFVVNVLGQVQIRGNCPDGVEFGKAWNEWDDEVYDAWYTKNTDKLDPAMDKINSCVNLGVYYDMRSDRQARIEFEWEAYGELGYSGSGIDSYLVIVFGDGSRYALDDYFTEEAFSYLFDTYESFIEDYEELLGVVTDSEVPDSLQRASLVR